MSFTANNTYGEYKHKLTIGEMPSHSHQSSIRVQWWNDVKDNSIAFNYGKSNLQVDRTICNTFASGDNIPHNNIQPSICVYFWRRKS